MSSAERRHSRCASFDAPVVELKKPLAALRG
jgi:hypothetical protein